MPVDKNGITESKSSLPAAPRGAPRLVRIAAIVGPICSVLSIAPAFLDVSQGHGIGTNGIATLTYGFVMSVFWFVIMPAARLSGKR